MEQATISELKNRLSAYLKRVVAGNPVLVLDRGRPIAKLERIEAGTDADERLARLERAGLARRGRGAVELPALADEPQTEVPGVVEALLAERRTGR